MVMSIEQFSMSVSHFLVKERTDCPLLWTVFSRMFVRLTALEVRDCFLLEQRTVLNGRQNNGSSKDVHTFIPGTFEYVTLWGKWELMLQMELRMLIS